jgi:molybdopterin converting factor small subunit
MSVRIRIPTPLRRFTAELDVVAVDATSIRGALDALDAKHPGIKARLCDEQGALRRFVNVYYKDEDVRFLEGLETSIADGTEISIVPAIAGG